MAAIDFKSVGERADAPRFRSVTNETPIGIKTPLRFGFQNDGIFAMHFRLSDQIHDNFKNLLLSNHGDRLGLYDFGANLRELTLEYGKDSFDVDAIVRIRTAVAKYMPFLEPRTFESFVDPRETSNAIAKVRIRISYDVPRLGITGKAIEVELYVGG